MNNTISVTKLYSFFQLFDDYNYNKSDLASSISTTLSEINSPDYRLSIEQIETIFKKASRLCNDKLFGLKYGFKLYKSFSSVLGVLLTSCKDINEVLNNFCNYEKVLDSTITTNYKVHNESLIITMTQNRNNNNLPEQYLEYKVSGFIAYVRNIVGDENLTPLKVNFKHSPYGNINDYEKTIGSPVSFNENQLSIIFHKSILNYLTLEPNSVLKRLMLTEVQKEFDSLILNTSYTSRVIKILSSQTSIDVPSLSQIAIELNMSERLLQKHLKSEGITYTSIINEFKRDKAIKYLENPMNTIDEIAFILGFSERSSFDRAFKKWTNSTPIEYRLTI